MNQQTAANEEAREAVDTIEYIWNGLLTIWESFPDELKAYLLCMFTISIMMQWLKKAVLVKMTKRERVQKLWVASLPFGIVIAGAGRVLSGNHIADGYWVLTGLTVGTVAMGVHYATVKIVTPFLGAIWARVMLAVRGAPRD